MPASASDQLGEMIQYLSNNDFKDASKNVRVRREGKQIVLPEGMQLEEGIFHLLRIREYEEKEVAIRHRIPCYPLDGAVALSRVIQRYFGFSTAEAEQTFFGSKPPVLLSVPTGVGESEQIIWGRVTPPVLEGGFIQPQADTNPRSPALIISGKVKRKFDAQIKELTQMVEQELREHSIYRGKAFKLDLAYMQKDPTEEGFDPLADGPVFMDTNLIREDELLMTPALEAALFTSIYQRIERTNFCRKSNIPLRHRILLSGPYGTGKSSVGRITSRKAVDNGWSFIYLPNANDLAEAIPVIKLMLPAVVFVEDIDKTMGDGEDERTDDINRLMNALSGISDKDDALIVVMTTNRPDKIQEGFLRPGRIDTAIHLKAPDAPVAEALMRKYLKDDLGRSLLASNTKLEGVAVQMAENQFVPAFIEETCRKAALLAAYKLNLDDVEGKVELSHLEASLATNLAHLNFMRERAALKNQRNVPDEFVAHMARKVAEVIEED